jgi:ATP-binding cassette subfamily F protein uup
MKERQELADMEDTIVAAETRVAELESALSDPAVFRERGAEVPAMVAELDAARARVDALYARWHELEALAARS